MTFTALRRRAIIGSAGIATAVILPLAGPVLSPAQAATSTTSTVTKRVEAAPKKAATKPKQSLAARKKAAAVKRGKLIVKVAARYKGKPYRYGATGPKAFDCSGFTRFVVKKAAKVQLPRTAAQQHKAKKLKKIKKSKRMVGDLVFFHRGGTIGHVGIYAGGGKMWAAPKPGDKVKKQKIYSSKVSYGRLK